ncbi:MAG: hypothetical protein M1824_004713 [Vezdaea acicularis]|nr:MAG: hypothetical protein M1824_004713 [Vezdaea acicularis]
MASTNGPSAHNKLHVIVIGAGVTGLLVAHGLKKAGISFSIYEAEVSAQQYRPREWSMGIHWSLPLLEKLLPADLFSRLRETQNDPFYEPQDSDLLQMYSGKSGEVLKALPMGKIIRVSRRKLRKFLTEGIDVQYDKVVADIIYDSDGKGVVAKFADGSETSGSIIIGTDGPQSTVRSLLLEGEKGKAEAMALVHANLSVCYHDAEKAKFVRTAHPVFSMMLHPEVFSFISIQEVPDPEKPEDWKFQLVTSWLGTPDTALSSAEGLALVKKKASVLADPFKSANLWIPEGTPISFDRLSYWATIPWDNHGGRVTLAGDAAHPMPPHRGQGLNHAICDADHFVNALVKVHKGESSLAEVIGEYDEELVPRGAEEVISSKQNALMLHDWNRLMDSPLMTRSLERTSK